MIKCLDQKVRKLGRPTKTRSKPLKPSKVRHDDPWLAGYRRQGCGWPVGSEQHDAYKQGLADADADEKRGGNCYQPYYAG